MTVSESCRSGFQQLKKSRLWLSKAFFNTATYESTRACNIICCCNSPVLGPRCTAGWKVGSANKSAARQLPANMAGASGSKLVPAQVWGFEVGCTSWDRLPTSRIPSPGFQAHQAYLSHAACHGDWLLSGSPCILPLLLAEAGRPVIPNEHAGFAVCVPRMWRQTQGKQKVFPSNQQLRRIA